MAELLVILTEEIARAPLLTFARARSGRTGIVAASSKAELAAILAESAGMPVRLIAFCTSVIVGPEHIAALGLTPYNIHPGTADYPGVHPEAFAHANAARVFGATAHEMVTEIDAGPIVACAEVDIPPHAPLSAYADAGCSCALDLFQLIVNQCLASDGDLPRMADRAWQGPRNRLADYRARFGIAA